ncbi:hypothetical protein Xcel_2652 [Xylanimonas cellulosilytica DSM 15894]|uniref:SMODS and SLOG-associating 2TM effector domain-containing protein n=1 Tax=Xylanimonas cellulosilytica (strain DSM 15894 / JCM 12276 / CECT 5975 / KCTC 9989 / LMG 20990 / NBRC 107835 / XIL07) TaxID=446471 RepID=D1BX98_XYLCX|nr:hypothetical protein [Xylanimonas cellulosilytica]ACZ31666.1 hypothetical protein Xcel_2652 [Xylanimonas cellulosilytica DSM 15894]
MPVRVWIGATGHRDVPEAAALVAAIRQVIVETREAVQAVGIDGVVFGVVSALAEGADRVIARTVLDEPGAVLEVTLPLPADEYEQDFADDASRADFRQLLDRAAVVRTEPAAAERESAYMLAGYRVVERSDVLIAVWDERAGRGLGGTADVVAAARRAAPTPVVYRIVPGTWHLERDGGSLDLTPYVQLARFDSELTPAVAADAGLAETVGRMAGLPDEALAPWLRWIAPPFAHADALAVRYQRLYNLSTSGLFAGSALAVALGAFQVIAFHDQVWLVGSELVLLIALLALVVVARRGELHARWLSYRALAELCRSAFFLALVEETSGRARTGTSIGQRTGRWVPRAAEELWLTRPQDEVPLDVGQLRDLLLRCWVDDQSGYQLSRSRRLELREKASVGVLYVLFAVTLVAVAIHLVADLMHDEEWLAGTFALVAIVLPAVGAALGALRAQRDYQQNAVRARHSGETLATLSERLSVATRREELHGVSRQVAEHLAQENLDWYGGMLYRDVELHV